MIKIRWILLIGYFSISFGQSIGSPIGNELSIEDIEQKSQPGLLTRLLECLFGKKRLDLYEQRSRGKCPGCPSPYKW